MSVRRINRLSLKNKIFFSTLAVILLLSVGIGLVARGVLISSLISRLETRGLGIAQSIAESGRTYVLTQDTPQLTRLVFDATHLGAREALIYYIFVVDKKGDLLAHTFTDNFPEKLLLSNRVPAGKAHSIALLQVGGERAYDIAVPVTEGIHRIGTVHVGLNKRHIDRLIGKLQITFLGFIAAIALIFFGISHWLAGYITRPIRELIRMTNEISRGILDVSPGLGTEVRCWELRHCQKANCPAYHSTELPCWYVDDTARSEIPERGRYPEKLRDCYGCPVYRNHLGDEISQLADSFNHMTRSLKASQEKLRESEEKYRSLSDSGPNPVFVVDKETLEILDANPSAQLTYGYTREELLGRPFTDLGPFKYGEREVGEPQMGGAPGECVVINKIQHFKKGNRPFYVNARACPTRYEDREAIILATTDITELIEKDAQLIQASKMTALGEMSAGIAHELNQPLNAIKVGNEFLKMMIEGGKEIQKGDLYRVVTEVSGQVDRASEIINRLRDFGRKADFTRERVGVNKAVQDVLAIIAHQLALQNIVIELDLDETLPPILAHTNRLEQVIFNLITNARDAINQTGEASDGSNPRIITIRSFWDRERIAFAVSDTGTGIPEEVGDKIFEPFYTTKEMGKGMGLGLSIIKGIVREYGGDIDVHSESGKGTTFELTFPCAPTPSGEVL